MVWKHKKVIARDLMEEIARKHGIADTGAVIDEIDPEGTLAEQWREFREALEKRGVYLTDDEWSEHDEKIRYLSWLEDEVRRAGLLDELYDKIAELSSELLERDIALHTLDEERRKLSEAWKEVAISKEEYERRKGELDRFEEQLKKYSEELGRIQFRIPAMSGKEAGEAIEKVRQVKPKVPGLSKEEIRRLEDEFKAALMKELGRVPRDVMAEFRVNLEKVRMKPYAEALSNILELTREIVGREAMRIALERPPPPERIVRVGIEERPPVEVPPEVMVYPAKLPEKPKSELPFPRSPTSEERREIWDWFIYEMARIGQDPYRYRLVFQQHLDIPYRTWEGLLKTLREIVEDIKEGREIKLMPLLRMPMPWEEKKGVEKWRRDAIVHFVATKLHKTLDELIEALSEWGVYPRATVEEIKEVVRDAWKTKDVWFTSVTKEELETLLGQPIES